MIVLDDLSYHDCAFQDKGTQKTGAPVVSKLLTVCPTLRKLDLSGLYKWSVSFPLFFSAFHVSSDKQRTRLVPQKSQNYVKG